jgi:hypothetical protein
MMHARLLVAGLACLLAPVAGAETIPAPSLAGFEDAIHHWRNVHGDAYPRYAPDQVALIADNILRYQRVDGGWIENQDPARILDDAEKARVSAEARKSGGSFDNRNIYTQLDYLAAAYAITGDTRSRSPRAGAGRIRCRPRRPTIRTSPSPTT